MDNYSFYTHVKVSIFSPDELLDYKRFRGNSAFPKQNKIKVFLPDWFVKEINAQIDTTGKIRFSEINNSFKNSAFLILGLAKTASLSDHHSYRMGDQESAKLLVSLKQDKTNSSFIPLIKIHETPNKQESVIKFLNFIVYTILNIKSEDIKEKVFTSFNLENQDNKKEDEDFRRLKNCINHLFFWLSNHASRNLQKEITQLLNAKTHFIREYGNWFARETLKAKYMYIEYKTSFEAITCPIDYSTRKLNDALFELEERKKAGTIDYSNFEILTYYKKQEVGDFIKGAVVRLFNFINSDFPVCFVFKMRSVDTETLKEELLRLEDQSKIQYPDNYKNCLNL